MSDPHDGDRSAMPNPEQNGSGGQPWAQQPQPTHSGDPGQGYGAGPGTPAYAQQPAPGASWAPARQTTKEANFFRAMVDFRFDHFITVKFSSFLYVVAFLIAALLWLGQIISGIVFGAALGNLNSAFYEEPSFNAVPLILAIIFGWIPSVVALILMRLGLEFSVATVRTAQNTTKIAEATAAGR